MFIELFLCFVSIVFGAMLSVIYSFNPLYSVLMSVKPAKYRRNYISEARSSFSGFLKLRRDLDRRNFQAVIGILSWCKENMRAPRMLHYVVGIDDFMLFKTNGFVQRLKEKFASSMLEENKRRNKIEGLRKRSDIPEIQVIYSIESKKILSDFQNPGSALIDYLHVHLLVIVDIGHRRFGPNDINIALNKALSKIQGLESLHIDPEDGVTFWNGPRKMPIGFLKLRNEKTTIHVGRFINKKWHDVKIEFDDAVCRASYLCKLDQKGNLPIEFNRGNSFGHTRPKLQNETERCGTLNRTA